MPKTLKFPGIKPWLESIGKNQRWLMRELGESDPSKINARATWRRDIPLEWEPKLRELGYDGPLKKSELEASQAVFQDQADLLVQMDLRVANLKGYMEAQFKAAHDERETLAEILRAIAERQEEIAVKVGLAPLKLGRASRKTG